MRNYFLTLSDQQKQQLRDGGVAFYDLNIDGQLGIVIEEDFLLLVLRLIQATVGEESQSSLDGIFHITLQHGSPPASPPRRTVKVAVPDWVANGVPSGPYVEVIQRLLPGFDEVAFHAFEREPESKRISRMKFEKPNCWRVIIWGSPEGNYCDGNSTLRCLTAWGISSESALERTNWWAPSELGEPILNPDSGQPIAEIDEQTLFIFAPITCDKVDGVKIFEKILAQFLVLYNISPEEKMRRVQERVLAQQKLSRQHYISLCGKRFERTIEGTRQAIVDGKKGVQDLQARIVRTIRETQGAERKLAQLEACRKGDQEKFGREFDRLLQVPKVRDIRIEEGQIRVFTDILTCTDPRTGKRHEIGAFQITIYIDGLNGGVNWCNLTRKVNSVQSRMNGPHIKANGEACMGNTEEIFPELIGNYEFAAVAMLAIQFAESVNVDDQGGARVDLWPEAA